MRADMFQSCFELVKDIAPAIILNDEEFTSKLKMSYNRLLGVW